MARDQTLPPVPSLEKLLEEANNEVLNKPPKKAQAHIEPATEQEAADMLQRAGWQALARLAGIISNPNASDMLAVQAAKEIANQLQKRDAQNAAGMTFTLMPVIRIDNVELIYDVGEP